MYVYRLGDYCIILIRTTPAQVNGAWATMDHYVVVHIIEDQPPMEVLVPEGEDPTRRTLELLMRRAEEEEQEHPGEDVP
ncbi:hypothetical protein [Streptosporangium sp. NPDC051022]|uniref:hypothetical protein n=1 Tax=Streptosporangium sp. NPDC051022 TaxID=3155752 RepID=UPI0034148DE7